MRGQVSGSAKDNLFLVPLDQAGQQHSEHGVGVRPLPSRDPLGEATEPAILTVRIGAENEVAGLQSTSVVSTWYGNADQPLAKLGVLGATRMDYPGTMGAVGAVARYVGQILAES